MGVRPDRKIRAERKDPGEGLFSVVAAAGLFSGCGEQGLLSRGSARASRCGAWALECTL